MVWKSWIFFVIWETWSFWRHWNTDILSVFRWDNSYARHFLPLITNWTNVFCFDFARPRFSDQLNFLSPNFRNRDSISHQSRCDAPRQIRCSFKQEKSSVWRRIFLLNIYFGEWKFIRKFQEILEVGELVKSYDNCRWGDARNGRRFVTSGSAKGTGPTRGCNCYLNIFSWFLDLVMFFFCFNKVASTKIKNCNKWHFVFHLFHLFNKTTEMMALLCLKHLRRWSQ